MVSAPNPVLPPRSSTSTSPAAFPARRALAGCSTDSNAKNRPAMGAPKPAEMPAALPAATSPSRRDANRARRRLARRDSFALAPSRSRSASVWLPKKPPEPPEEDVVASWRLPAIEAPISTLGPSGPSDAPAPRVTTAAAASAPGARRRAPPPSRIRRRRVGRRLRLFRGSDRVLSCFEPHLGAPRRRSPREEPEAGHREPRRRGRRHGATACTHASGRTSRMPSTRNRSGEYTVVVRNTRSCTPCSAMLNAPTPRPVSRPTPHATASKSVGLGRRARARGRASVVRVVRVVQIGAVVLARARAGGPGLGPDPGRGRRRPSPRARGEASAEAGDAGGRASRRATRAHPLARKTNATRHVPTGDGSADPDVDATAHDAARAWGVGASTTRRAHAEACGAATSARMPAVSRCGEPRVAWCREAERPETRVES